MALRRGLRALTPAAFCRDAADPSGKDWAKEPGSEQNEFTKVKLVAGKS